MICSQIFQTSCFLQVGSEHVDFQDSKEVSLDTMGVKFDADGGEDLLKGGVGLTEDNVLYCTL